MNTIRKKKIREVKGRSNQRTEENGVLLLVILEVVDPKESKTEGPKVIINGRSLDFHSPLSGPMDIGRQKVRTDNTVTKRLQY